jgi:hypothetical protein
LNFNRDIFPGAWVQIDIIENCIIVNSLPAEVAANTGIMTTPNPVKSFYRVVMPESIHGVLMCL